MDRSQRSTIATARNENIKQKTVQVMLGGQDEVEGVHEEVAPDAAPAPQNDIIMNDCIDNESEDSRIECEDEFD